MQPKNQELLTSMALRSRHDFGILRSDQKESVLKDMSLLYDLYEHGMSDEEISDSTVYNKISVKQIREEVNGKGLFNNEKADFFKNFG